MQCPVCNDSQLMMTDRQGVEIDYCPKCRGVWLDRGELDKIIERASPEVGTGGGQPRPGGDYRPGADYRPGGDYHGKHRSKRKGLLGELFDF